ncbi:hypothetical protein BG004_007653 [Podila humilis]|nr:hypothetical protein BG004_007653 [Podila humilis]
MKFLTTMVLLAATCLATTTHAGLMTCGSHTNDFLFKSTSTSPSPANPKQRFCVTIYGKVQSDIPPSSKATYSFSHEKVDVSYKLDFLPTLDESATGSVKKGSRDHLTTCFFFPPEYEYVTNSVISLRIEVQHPNSSGRNKRVLCVHGDLNV